MNEREFREAFHGNKDVLYRFAYRMTGSHAAAAADGARLGRRSLGGVEDKRYRGFNE